MGTHSEGMFRSENLGCATPYKIKRGDGPWEQAMCSSFARYSRRSKPALMSETTMVSSASKDSTKPVRIEAPKSPPGPTTQWIVCKIRRIFSIWTNKESPRRIGRLQHHALKPTPSWQVIRSQRDFATIQKQPRIHGAILGKREYGPWATDLLKQGWMEIRSDSFGKGHPGFN